MPPFFKRQILRPIPLFQQAAHAFQNDHVLRLRKIGGGLVAFFNKLAVINPFFGEVHLQGVAVDLFLTNPVEVLTKPHRIEELLKRFFDIHFPGTAAAVNTPLP